MANPTIKPRQIAPGITNSLLASDVGRLNQLVNGGFEVWQRGSGPFTGGGTGFGPDRWQFSLAGSDTLSASKNTANLDLASLACAACTFVLGTGAGVTCIYQVLKLGADGYQLAGRTISLSARVSVNIANAVRINLRADGTGGGVGIYSGYHSGNGQYQTLTTTITVPTDATSVFVAIYFSVSCTAYVDNAMLAIGSVAADYQPIPPADDLARCLRYYQRWNMVAGQYLGVGQCISTTQALIAVAFTASMGSSTPSVNFSNYGHFNPLTAAAGAGGAAASIGVQSVQNNELLLLVGGSSGLVAGNATALQANNAASYMTLEWNP